ncbi:single-stranded DNA-binding protein [Mycobacterium sp. M1]|uniref:Single-stranded DNA-binding protein n=1 Tax=Mycolicibacter acidiphilus TaxID=2835306 RepID=A0ABS5RIK9_9MYCO|nr:single-stranded DNA-binding protein [Mycolicibacter acidiphilus]MBS9533439.1 single-stranded DNA-binding protein [Mycolicibacter acidiphilus]
MFETALTVVGNIVNDPICRVVGQQEVMNFRVASNSRRRGADGNWEQGNSLFVSVSCWGRLVTGVRASLRKGSPVVVTGNVHSRDYEDRDGVRRSALEMRATAVGPDLARCVARVEKLVPAGPDAPVTPAEQSQDVPGDPEDGLVPDDELTESAA